MPTQPHVESLDRTLQALDLRRKGYSYVQIAAMMGYAYASGAEKAVRRALKYVIREPAEAVRKLELDRLDSMLNAIWPRVQRGDLLAMDRALRIEERRAKLLGLDHEEGDRGPLIIQVVEGATGKQAVRQLEDGSTVNALPEPSQRPSTIDERQSTMDFEPEEEEEIPTIIETRVTQSQSVDIASLLEDVGVLEQLQQLDDEQDDI